MEALMHAAQEEKAPEAPPEVKQGQEIELPDGLWKVVAVNDETGEIGLSRVGGNESRKISHAYYVTTLRDSEAIAVQPPEDKIRGVLG
jgi:hypothetical protein